MRTSLVCYLFVVTTFLFFSTNPIAAQTETKKKEKVQILLLGTFHFNNPGLDEFNNTVDDVYSDQRQKEIAALNDSLTEFHADKVFIEMPVSHQKIQDSLYSAYTAGTFQFKDHKYGRSEHFQIGYRMAKKWNHKRIYASDANGIWLGSAVKKMAIERRMIALAQREKEMEKEIAYEDSLLRTSTLGQFLRVMNTNEAIMRNHSYYITLAPQVITGEDDGASIYHYDKETDKSYVRIDENYIGAELTAEWYKRNIKIYSNILTRVEKGDKRILVIYGQGHIRILKHLFEDHPDFEVVDALDYL